MKKFCFSSRQIHLLNAGLILFVCFFAFKDAAARADLGFLSIRPYLTYPAHFIFKTILQNNFHFLPWIQAPAGHLLFDNLFADFSMFIFARLFSTQIELYYISAIFLLALASLSVYALVLKVAKNNFIALLASLIFCLSPINNSLVNNLSSIIFSFQIIFMCLSIIWFLKSKAGTAAKSTSTSLLRISLFFYLLACLCHPTALILPLYIGLILRFTDNKKASTQNALKKISPYACVFIPLLTINVLKSTLLTPLPNKLAVDDLSAIQALKNFCQLIISALTQMATGANIVPETLIHGSFMSIGWCCLIAVAFFVAIKFSNYFVRFCLSWIICGFIPILFLSFNNSFSGCIFKIEWIGFSSIGFSILMAFLLAQIKNKWPALIFYALTGLLLASQFMVSQLYHSLWQDHLAYCQYWFNSSGAAPEAEYRLAKTYLKQGRIDMARFHYASPLKKNYRVYEIITDLASFEYNLKNTSFALEYFQWATLLNPTSATAHNNLGSAYLQDGKPAKARKSFLTATSLDPYLNAPRLNLIFIAFHQNRFEEALAWGDKNFYFHPKDETNLFWLVKSNLSAGNLKNAQIWTKVILETTHNDQLLVNLGTMLAPYGLRKIPHQCFTRAMKLNPGNVNIYLNFGKYYGNLNDFQRAIILWEMGQVIDPQNPTFDKLILKAQSLQ